MDIILFFLFSMGEYLSIFYLTLLMFSFQPKGYIKPIIVSSLILSTVSFIMRSSGIAVLDVLIQIILYIILLRLLFKVNIYYSLVMSYGYICVVVLQITIYYVLHITGILKSLVVTEQGIHIIQAGTIIITVIIALVLRWFDFRYSFVPYGLNARVVFKEQNLYLFVLIISEVLIVTLSYYFLMSNFNVIHSIFSVLLLLFSGLALYHLEKREYHD